MGRVEDAVTLQEEVLESHFQVMRPCRDTLSVNCQASASGPAAGPPTGRSGPRPRREGDARPDYGARMGKPAALRPKPKRDSFTTVGENRWSSCKVACARAFVVSPETRHVRADEGQAGVGVSGLVAE